MRFKMRASFDMALRGAPEHGPTHQRYTLAATAADRWPGPL
jgi:hypothetical protein